VHPPAEPRSSWARLCSRAARTVLLTFLFTGPFTGLDAILGVITGVGPAEARAQKSPESEPPLVAEEDKARARVYFERAETLKHSGSARAQSGDADGARAAYAEAADVYMRAFELFPHPAFLYNVAQMLRLSGKSARAIGAYERYLKVDPEGDKAEEARAYIAELRREQAARPGTAVKARPAAEKPARGAGDAEGDDEAEDAAEDGEDGEDGDEDAGDEDAEDGDEDADGEAGDDAEDAGADAAGDGEVPAGLGAASDFDDEDEDRDTGRPLRIAGMAAAAAGAIAFGIGVKYGLDARSISDELSGPRFMWDLDDRELFAEGERAERNAIILMGIGGAALVTGGVLYLVGSNQDGDEAGDGDLGVSASATSDGASMLLWGRF
jgi:tetratricopeptide (TPR) repeat protein